MSNLANGLSLILSSKKFDELVRCKIGLYWLHLELGSVPKIMYLLSEMGTDTLLRMAVRTYTVTIGLLGECMLIAIKHKQVSTVKALLQLGAINYNQGLEAAAEYCEVLVSRFIELGATQYRPAILAAARGQNLELVRDLLFEHTKTRRSSELAIYNTDITLAAATTATDTRREVWDFYKDEIMNSHELWASTVRSGNISRVKQYMERYGVIIDTRIIYEAIKSGNSEVIKVIISKGTSQKDIARAATKAGNWDIFSKYIKESFVTANPFDFLSEAAEGGNRQILEYLKYKEFIASNKIGVLIIGNLIIHGHVELVSEFKLASISPQILLNFVLGGGRLTMVEVVVKNGNIKSVPKDFWDTLTRCNKDEDMVTYARMLVKSE